jgi:hypothetical protein
VTLTTLHVLRAERTATFCPLSDNSGQMWILAGDGLSAYDPKRTSEPHNNALPCRLHRSRNVLVFRFVPMGRGLAGFDPQWPNLKW